ncbi:speckle-type POZ protein-like [Schistocerca nitens]|uniref:speckle-type POZ protein-like n=1 Tax=Schistocerca nitens TaxID=7011 RepID=UPI0021196557|nr:speckle-type POZ protein-like [Schistocerca nitens]XP_049795520.1 speckle-type POZ protein-like [Schistocerca nitens]
MSFNARSFNYEFPGGGFRTIDIAEVATGIPTILKESSGTNFEYYTFVKTWTVRGLKTLEGTAEIKSLSFTHQNFSKWCMVLTKKNSELFLHFLLEKCEPGKLLRAKLKADEILPSGEKREVFPSEWYELEEGRSSKMQLVRKADCIGEDNGENEITLQCEVCMRCIVHDELPTADTAEHQSDVARAVGEMYSEEVHTDFELHTEGSVLKAHKSLLSVRSPYFAALLQPHTKEAKEGFVQITDVKTEALKQVLLFMYTGVAPALKDMPWDLLIAADKFQLQQLKRQCEAHIASHLDVDNAAETAANALLFSCDMLWDRAVFFIRSNLCQVMRTPGWALVITAHPEAIQRLSELMG